MKMQIQVDNLSQKYSTSVTFLANPSLFLSVWQVLNAS